MPMFAYKAKGADGVVVSGLLDQPDEKAARERLRMQKMMVVEIGPASMFSMEVLDKLMAGKGSVSSKDLVIFSRQLSTLVGAGVPIVQGLAILESQCENPRFKDILCDVRNDIESGLSISDALKKHPEAFPELYTAMVRAGELGGILDTILERLTSYLENTEELRQKVKAAMMYPAIVLSICGLVTLFLMVFVIPTFEKIFEGFGAELPMLTQILIDISHFLTKFFLLVLLAPVGIFKAFQKFYATEKGVRVIDGWILKAPIFGIILKKVAVAKFTRTLGTLVKSGVPIMQALETVAQTAGNAVISDAVLTARESIREGGRLADPLKKSGVFPNMVISMIAIGEETGSLDIMLGKIADFYDMEVDNAVKGLTSMIEPIVIVIMGVIVGTIVTAMFLPMFGMGELAGDV